jgi:UDP-2,3-diacylglucosamine hydrolase
LAFRAQVRSLPWQAQFLSQPLAQRQAMARQMREHSQRQQAERWQQGAGYVDVDEGAARRALEQAGATTLIHGHTHRPARHELGDGLTREVLSDWDAQATPPRAQVLRLNLLTGQAPRLERVSLL